MRQRLIGRLWRAAWGAVALFAYRRWAVPEGRAPTGVPGNRDPDHPCPMYAPRRRELGDADCNGDGHYLCRGEGVRFACAHYVPEEADAGGDHD